MNINIIILCLIYCAFFSRLLSSIGVPSIVNFIHFPLIIGMSIIIFMKYETKLIINFIYLLLIFFSLIIMSAIINESGMINAVLEFIILTEPLLLIFCICTVKWCMQSIKIFRNGLIFIMIIHLIFIFYQFFILKHISDDVVGILLNMGAGSHLSGAITLSTAVYLYFYTKSNDINILIIQNWKWLVFIASLVISVIFSDAKQAFAAFLMALILLSLINITDIRKTVTLIIASCLSIFIIYMLGQTLLPSLTGWIKLDLLQEGIGQKLSIFSIIYSFQDSPLQWFLGFGPGHTVGRLAMLLPDYITQLKPFGVTTSEITFVAWLAHQGHYMSNSITGSSMFSLFFSWAGFWGDIGFLGVALYLYMYYLIWKMIEFDELSKFLLLTIFVFGWIFQWMEEPQYMLFTMSLIGIRWQESQYLPLLEIKNNE